VTLPETARSVNVVLVIDVESIGLLNVALTVVPVATPVAPLAGVVDATVGAADPLPVLKTTSTQ
jgi:hypothetical protein